MSTRIGFLTRRPRLAQGLMLAVALAAGLAFLSDSAARAQTNITSDRAIPPTANISNNARPTAIVSNGATLTLADSGLVQHLNINMNGSHAALELGLTDGSQDGFLVMTGGEIESNNTSDGTGQIPDAIRLFGSSTATVSGGLLDINESGNGDARAVLATDSSVFTLSGTAVIDVSEEDGNNGLGIVANDNSTINLLGGSLILAEANGGTALALIANGDSTLNIDNGFSYSMTGGNTFVQANGASEVNVTGGNIVNQGGGGAANSQFVINDDAVINFLGVDFFIDGSPVELDPMETFVITGVIDDFLLSGTLADGTMFADVPIFLNATTATLTLTSSDTTVVPEPSGLALAVVGALGLVIWSFVERRRRAS